MFQGELFPAACRVAGTSAGALWALRAGAGVRAAGCGGAAGVIGGRRIQVRGHKRVMAHFMSGICALSVGQLIRLLH